MNILLIFSGIAVAIAAMLGIFAHSRSGAIWFTWGGVVLAITAAFVWFQGTVPSEIPTQKAMANGSFPGTEKSIAAISPPIATAPGEIGWNFSSFLGMTAGAYDADVPAPQFRVQTFQAFGRNTWSSTITKIEGYVEIDRTGERFPLLLNQDGTPVDLGQLPPVEIDERTAILCYFTQDRSKWDGSWQGIEPNIFLNRYTPFTFVVSVNGGEERRYPFSTENCKALIQSFKDNVRRSRN